MGKRLFLNATAFYTRYTFEESFKGDLFEIYGGKDTLQSNTRLNKLSQIEDAGFYFDFDLFCSNSHRIVSGVQYIHHVFQPSNKSVIYSDNLIGQTKLQNSSEILGNEFNGYLEDRISFSDHWDATVGLHYSHFAIGEKSYDSFQPRVRSAFQFNRWAIKFSGGYMVQPIHNLVNNSGNKSASMWMPSGGPLEPSTSLQFDFGFDWKCSTSYLFSAESYWRKMNHIITYQSRESFFKMNEKWYDRIQSGSGKAYGVELTARKTKGVTTGMLGYTWSVSRQQFEQLNQGRSFPAPFDRPHTLSLLVTHRLSKQIELSGNWIYATGEPVTLSVTSYPGYSAYSRYTSLDISSGGGADNSLQIPAQILYTPSVNNWRMPAYHRLDLAVDYRTIKKRGIRTWTVSVYNAYARSNPYMYNFKFNDQGRLVFHNITYFKMIPSISYRYEFK